MSESFRPVENLPPELLVLERIQPAIAALHWHNFLKRLSNEVPETEARELLIKYLMQDSGAVAVPLEQIPLLDADVELSVAELKQYLVHRLRPQNSFLVRSGARPDKQRLPEVDDLRWDDIPDSRDIRALVTRLETEQARWREQVDRLLGLLESDGDSAEANQLRDRFEAVKDAVLHLHRLDRTDPQQLPHIQHGLEKVIGELKLIHAALTKDTTKSD